MWHHPLWMWSERSRLNASWECLCLTLVNEPLRRDFKARCKWGLFVTCDMLKLVPHKMIWKTPDMTQSQFRVLLFYVSEFQFLAVIG